MKIYTENDVLHLARQATNKEKILVSKSFEAQGVSDVSVQKLIQDINSEFNLNIQSSNEESLNKLLKE